VNLPSTLRLPTIVDNEIAAKLMAKRMLGPFSITQANIIFGGHFHTSPLSIIENIPSSGKWQTIHHISKEDDKGELTNRWLNVNDLLMKYYSVNMTADFVCTPMPLAL